MYAEVFGGERWKPAERLVENEDFDPEEYPIQPRFRPQNFSIPPKPGSLRNPQ
jgi:hypothetical protein